jgi:hypothetical protein
MVQQGYEMMMNHQLVPVPSFPPPFFTSPRHQGPQYYTQHAPVSTSYTFHQQQLPQAEYAAYHEVPVAPVVTSTTTFNPAAQVFVPPAEQLQPGLYQSPPPAVVAVPPTASYHNTTQRPNHQHRANPSAGLHHNTSTSSNVINNNNTVLKNDPNLLVSLKSPPAPLPFNRGLEARNKQFSGPAPGSKFAASSKLSPSVASSSMSRPLPEKTSMNNRHQQLPPRFQRSRENYGVGGGSGVGTGGGGGVLTKPPSHMEMQSIGMKKGPFPRPPAGQGNGLLVYGTSNIVNYLKTEQLTAQLNMPVRLIPAMKMDVFSEKVDEVSPERDWLVLIHGLGRLIGG